MTSSWPWEREVADTGRGLSETHGPASPLYAVVMKPCVKRMRKQGLAPHSVCACALIVFKELEMFPMSIFME